MPSAAPTSDPAALPARDASRAALPGRTRALLAVGMLAVSFSAILVRVADAPALALAFWRALGGAVVLAPFALRAGVRPTSRQALALVVGGVCLALHFALFIGAFAYTSVASVVVFTTIAPVFVGLGSWVFLRQAPTRRIWGGIAVSVMGAVVIGIGDAGAEATGSNPLLGDLMALGAAVTVSGYLLIGQRARATMPLSTYGTWVYGAAAAALGLAALVGGSALVGFDGVTWLAVLGMVVGPQLLGHTVFNHLLTTVPATTVSVVTLSEPIGAGLLAYLLLGEVPTPLMAVGAPLLLIGVYLASTGGRRISSVQAPGNSRST